MLKVTCAIIECEGKVLVCQRSASMKVPLKWEFPGGKVEHNEDEENSLKREIQEELGLQIEILYPLSPIDYYYESTKFRLYPYVCRLVGGKMSILEHEQAIWLAPWQLRGLDWVDADRPIVEEFLN